MPQISDSERCEASDGRAKAYKLGAKIAREQMGRDSPVDASALRSIEASDIIVVTGSYDQVENVLGAMGLPRILVDPDDLPKVQLGHEQILVINCPGMLEPESIEKIRDFVAGGGSLFTTDWALRNVIELAFPGIIEYNEHPTADDVVGIQIADKGNRFLAGVLENGEHPQWWLEGASYPIRILDCEKVEVLLSSRELARKYGEAPVAVRFGYGSGEVFHMISHYYLQRTELRTDRHKLSASAYAAEKGILLDARETLEAEGLALGDLESAANSARFIANVLAAKKRNVMESR